MTKKSSLHEGGAATNSRQRGFSLVELLVSISIITILSMSLVLQQSKFDNTIYLKNLAHEVALVVREAQSYATQGVNVGNCPGDRLDCPYGVHFNKDPDSDEYDFVIFRDNGNGTYDGTDEALPGGVYSIEGSRSISALCDDTDCASDVGDELTIMFQRPSPNPIIEPSANQATIELSSGGDTIKVFVLQSGQISVGDIES